MSTESFPVMPGIKWNVTKTPAFNTKIAETQSGREIRVSSRAYPVWEFALSYEFLRAGAEAELQSLIGFFLSRRGSWDSFLYVDSTEPNSLTQEVLGTADGVEKTFQCTKTLGGFTEPVGYVDPATVQVYLQQGETTNEILTGWTLNSKMQIVFDSPPADGAIVKATYTWKYRVRFNQDEAEFSNFMYELWELRQITFKTDRPT